MRKDEKGDSCPESLGEYLDICRALGGAKCKAVEFLEGKIRESPDGRDEKVIVADSQMFLLLMPMIIEEVAEPVLDEHPKEER